MFISKVKTKSIDRQNMENKIAGKTYVPFKLGTIVNDIPIWLEAQIPYSPNLEEMLYIHRMIKYVFNKTVKLLEEKMSLERDLIQIRPSY